MKEKNLIFVETAMKYPEIVRLVEGASKRIWHQINDETSFEYTCYRNIGIALLKEDVKSIGGIATRIISRAEAWFLKNRRREEPIYIEDIMYGNGEDEELTYDIPDVLADVEGELSEKEKEKEMAALLAKGDQRREYILNAWMEGEGNDSALAKELADSFPSTNAECQRKFIQRFRKECKRALVPA